MDIHAVPMMTQKWDIADGPEGQFFIQIKDLQPSNYEIWKYC